MLIIVPSRGRPQNVKELIEAFDATRRTAGLLIAVDNDDPKRSEYYELTTPAWVLTTSQERIRLGPTLNLHATRLMNESKIIGFMGDDHRPRTDAWDLTIENEMNYMGDTGIVYGNDLIQGPNIPTAVFISSNIIGVLGYMCPPTMTHMYLDNVWKLWGEKLGRLKYLPDVIIEHMHPVAKKSSWDEGYAEVNSGEMYAKDEAAMNEYILEKLDEDVAKMRELL